MDKIKLAGHRFCLPDWFSGFSENPQENHVTPITWLFSDSAIGWITPLFCGSETQSITALKLATKFKWCWVFGVTQIFL
jgi:hypothetical protein